jgi:WD40 repeat protein
MNRRVNLLVLCSLSIFCSSFLASSRTVTADDSASPTDSKTTWITSIARFGANKFVAASAGGLLLREATVYSFEANSPAVLTPLYKHPAAVWCVDSTSDGGKVASVDYRGNLVIFDSVTGESKTHEKAFERWCQSMMIAPSGTSIVAGNEAGKVMSWDLIAGKVIKTAELGGHAVTGLAISPDQSILAATDGSGHVHLLKWPTLEPAGKIKISDQTAWCVAFVDDGKSLLVGSSDRNLYKCDARDGATPKSVAKGTDWITQLAISPSGQIAAGEVGGRLHFPSTGGSDSMDAASGVWALCWNSDRQLYAGTRKDGIVVAGRSWKWTQAEPPAAPAKEAEATAEKEQAQEAKPEEPKAEKSEPKAEDAKPAEEKPKQEEPAEEEESAEEPKPEAEKPADE